MKIIDLSYLIHPDMPVYPGTELPVFQQGNLLEKDGFRETKISLYSHTGTHIDAPNHMLNNAPCLDNMDINCFFGKATILDFYNRKNSVITLADLTLHQEKISKVDFVIIKTGWSQYWGQEKYYKKYPFLSVENARWLSEFNLKGIGVDAISIDGSDSADFPVHKILLAKNIIIIENLTNLDAVKENIFMLSVLPLQYKNADGSPVRAIAIENIASF